MRSDAQTPEQYLAELPEDRRGDIAPLRALVLDNLPDGYCEAMNWGMIAYEVPLAASGKTYNGKPLMYAAIAAQKHHNALYLCGDPDMRTRLEAGFAKAGKRFNMGKACLRFHKFEDLAVEAVAQAIASVPMAAFIAMANARKS